MSYEEPKPQQPPMSAIQTREEAGKQLVQVSFFITQYLGSSKALGARWVKDENGRDKQITQFAMMWRSPDGRFEILCDSLCEGVQIKYFHSDGQQQVLFRYRNGIFEVNQALQQNGTPYEWVRYLAKVYKDDVKPTANQYAQNAGVKTA